MSSIPPSTLAFRFVQFHACDGWAIHNKVPSSLGVEEDPMERSCDWFATVSVQPLKRLWEEATKPQVNDIHGPQGVELDALVPVHGHKEPVVTKVLLLGSLWFLGCQ